MSNQSIIARILETIALFEGGATSASAVAASVELHEPALEGVPRAARDRMHALALEVIMQDVSPVEQEMLGWQSSRQASHALKSLLISLS